jgi:hypothetical protein
MSVGISQGTEDDEYTSEASFSKSKRRIPIDTETIRLYLTSVYVVYYLMRWFLFVLLYVYFKVLILCILL